MTRHLSNTLEGLEAVRDRAAVRNFAEAMDAKLAVGRDLRRSGWQQMSQQELWAELRRHVDKGDPVDIANYAMFIWHNGQQPGSEPVANSTDNMTGAEIKRAMVKRIASGEDFTFGSLWRPYGAGIRPDGADPYRIADRLIQRWRRRGNIAFRREGKDCVWRLTVSGSTYINTVKERIFDDD